jgi:hypothetical protein
MMSVAAGLPWELAGSKIQDWHHDRLAVVAFAVIGVSEQVDVEMRKKAKTMTTSPAYDSGPACFSPSDCRPSIPAGSAQGKGLVNAC